MKWLPGTPKGYGTTVSLFIVQKDVADDVWPGARFGSEPIGIIATKSRLAWLVAKAHPLDPEIEEELAAYRRQVKSRFRSDESTMTTLEGQQDKTGIRCLVSANRPTGERFCVAFAWDSIALAA